MDTGSTDDTKTIAVEFTERVYDYDWCNDWILVLDADEYVSNYMQKEVYNFVNDEKNEKVVGRIERINLI